MWPLVNDVATGVVDASGYSSHFSEEGDRKKKKEEEEATTSRIDRTEAHGRTLEALLIMGRGSVKDVYKQRKKQSPCLDLDPSPIVFV